MNLREYIIQLAKDAGVESPMLGDASGMPVVVDGATGNCYAIELRSMEAKEGDRCPTGFDQEQALREGWCVIENGDGVCEIQRNDEETDFPTDGIARAYVMEQCDEGSDYHRAALEIITERNKRAYQGVTGSAEGFGPIGFIFMKRRVWRGDAIAEEYTEKVRANYIEGANPYNQDACSTLGSNEDLVPLNWGRPIPDITWGNTEFHFAAMKVIEDRMQEPVACQCGNCDRQFPIDVTTEENMKLVRIEGASRLVAKCAYCGALAHQPKPR